MSEYTRKPRSARRNKRAPRILLVLALMLVVMVGSIAGTVAWLTDSTTPVTNTFTTAGIGISLTETWNTDSDDDGTNDSWTAQMIPGKEYTKDPVVAVDRTVTDVDIYLFVKFEENNTPSTYMDYTSTLTDANGWKLVENQSNVWYREVKATDTEISWKLLDGDKVTIRDSLTKENMPTSDKTPSLTYTAYAIQTEGFTTPALAWAKISKN